MRARLHPKGQLLAASPALRAVAWPFSKAQIGCSLLTGKGQRGSSAEEALSRSTHDLCSVQDCTLLQWKSSQSGGKDNLVGAGGIDMLAVACRTGVDVFAMSLVLDTQKDHHTRRACLIGKRSPQILAGYAL